MKRQITLGQLIQLLSHVDPKKEVRFDFARFTPGSLDSYRGYYGQLALSWGEDTKTAGDLLKECRETVGKVMQGYKGGDFTMHESTPVWVANYGDCHDTALVGVEDSYSVILETAYQ